jgi:sRNA-binding carbon storage regulator CsrA
MALILTRRAGESVKIGDKVTMTVREVHPKKIYVVFEDDGIQYPHWANLYGDIQGDIVKVNVTGISGRQVRLAFEADKSVKIMRSELVK